MGRQPPAIASSGSVVVLLVALAAACASAAAPPPLTEPYPPLHSTTEPGPAQPLSPDPLVATRWAQGVNSSLQTYLRYPQAVELMPGTASTAFTNLSSLVSGSASGSAQVAVHAAGSLRIDFGVESAAWLEVKVSPAPTSSGSPPANLLLSVSEYNEPGIYNAGPPHPNKTAVPAVYADGWLRLELNPQLYEGVRFGFVHVLANPAAPLTLTAARLVCQTLPTNYTGAFHSPASPLLERIWWTGAYTVRLNLLPTGFGAVLVDRGDRISWTGDAHTSQAAALAAFGNYDLIKLNLDRTSCPSCSNGIPSYALYWLLSLCDYFRYTGDEAALRQYAANVDARLAEALAMTNTNPPLHFFGSDDRLSADFEYPDLPECQRSYSMLVIRSLQSWIDALANCSSCDQSKVAGYKADTARLRAFARNATAPWHQNYGLHSAAGAVLSGTAQPSEYSAIFAREFTSPVQICSFSLFNMYFVLQAMAEMGQHQAALAAIERCWGPIITELNGTSFWETFSPEWTRFIAPTAAIPNGQTGYTSMCHPWAAGVVFWLSEHHLGLRPDAPGFARFTFAPGAVGVSGSVPTPHGTIAATLLELEGGEAGMGVVRMSVPRGVLGRVVIAGREVAVALGEGEHELVVRLRRDAAAGERETAVNLAKDLSQLRDSPPPLPPASAYAARIVGEDNTTAGNWIGKYGRDGYVLFSFATNGHDLSKLPPYISSCGVPSYIKQGKGYSAVFEGAAGSSDVRALQSPAAPSQRGLGFLATQHPGACEQTFLLDVVVSSPPPPGGVNVTLYVCDWDRTGRREMIEARDLVKYELVAPSVGVADFAGGRYITYWTPDSIRFRVNMIRDGDAVVSAVFFN